MHLRILHLMLILFLPACASVSPEQEAARRIDAIKCEHEGGKVYTGKYESDRWYYYECVPRREQERLERLELACVSAGGSVLYDSGNRKYLNCRKEGTKVKVNVNNNVNTSTPATSCVPDLNRDGRCFGGRCC